MKTKRIEIVNASDPYDTHTKGLKYDALKQHNDELVAIMKIVLTDIVWQKGSVTKRIVIKALKNNSK